MMKKNTFSNWLLAGTVVVLSACSETPTGPVNQAGFVPNQNFTNQPGFQQPGFQQPGVIQPGMQPTYIPNTMPTWNTPVPGSSGYMLQAYAYLQNNPSCLPVMYTTSAKSCRAYTTRSRCVVKYTRKKVRVKSCNCDRIVYVADLADGTTSEETTLVDANGGTVTYKDETQVTNNENNTVSGRKKGEFRLTGHEDNNVAENTPVKTEQPKSDQPKTDQVANNQPNNSDPTNSDPTKTEPAKTDQPTSDQVSNTPAVKEEKVEPKPATPRPLPTFADFTISGEDARAIYERLAIEKDKDRESIRRGPNIECDIDNNKKGRDSSYTCRFSLQLVEKDGIKMGELLALPKAGKAGSPVKTLEKTYPEKFTDLKSVWIKTKGDPTTEIYLAMGTQKDNLNVANVMANMPGAEADITIGDDQTLKAKAKVAGSLKCLYTINAGNRNFSQCMILIDVREGKGIPATL